jgi:hypothetical protein
MRTTAAKPSPKMAETHYTETGFTARYEPREVEILNASRRAILPFLPLG